MTTYVDIFHSSGTPIRAVQYGNIADLVRDGVITVSRRSLDNPRILELYAQSPWHPDNIGQPGTEIVYPPAPYHAAVARIRGGIEHTWLAAMGLIFLADLGYNVLCEVSRGYRRVDLASDNLVWFIECGDTNAGPVYDELRQTCTHFCVLPFDALYEPPFMYCFERGPNWDNAPRTSANAGVRLK